MVQKLRDGLHTQIVCLNIVRGQVHVLDPIAGLLKMDNYSTRLALLSNGLPFELTKLKAAGGSNNFRNCNYLH